ncbi:hypothetical protein FOT43_22675 [Serratia marcescens]|uniref:hypothetical protein n=1 Tax=Serratia marcescens TaxID=615 RepID=UPI00117D697F|nr:hypothetical protein [Serratia marcescens]TSB25671.1 hypothetical protein FOT43_22675 [Serratia marcescens]TXE43875.1 hypothetical protein FOT60_12650 [Serratia marcescens]
MNIEEKLGLSARKGKITLLREGLFLRCYEESLYAVINGPYPTLSVISRAFKNLNGRRVLYGGFSEPQRRKILPDAIEMEWGYECGCHDIDTEKYRAWWDNIVHHMDMANNEKVQEQNGVQILLDGECCRFLASWQPEAFPSAVDAGFIAAVKKKAGV